MEVLGFEIDIDNFSFGLSPMPNDDEEIEMIEKSDFAIYPNPANDVLNISGNWTLKDKIDLIIYNSIGKSVLSETTNTSNNINFINLEELSQGLYFVTITVNGVAKHTQKFTIIK